MCKDWLGKIIEYDVLFECLKPGCKERYSLDLCNGMEKFHHCPKMHDFNLNIVRELFGEYNPLIIAYRFFFCRDVDMIFRINSTKNYLQGRTQDIFFFRGGGRLCTIFEV